MELTQINRNGYYLLTCLNKTSRSASHVNTSRVCLAVDDPSCVSVLSGILKQVKDVIRECPECLNRRSSDDGTGNRLFARPARRRTTANANDEEEEEEEEGDSLVFADPSSQLRRKATAKHELVFVSFTYLPFCLSPDNYKDGILLNNKNES